jgi:hypothetical protein
MSNPAALHEFLRKAAYYRGLNRYETNERIYKLRLAHDLQEAADAMAKDAAEALTLFEGAIKSPDDNLINWRDQARLIDWIRSDSQARPALLRLWDTTQQLDTRLRGVEAILHAAGLTRPGTQLTVVSTLLMALSPYDHPPIRTRPFREAFRQLALPDFEPSDALPERYSKAIALVDYILANSGTLLRDRLDAQSVVWCIYSRGWGEVPPDFDPSASDPNLIDDALIAADPDLRDAPDTQRLALALARRGQGRFKYDLWRLWGRCALTGCRVPQLVHAAHIKPWSRSTNPERLDPYNGLLLLPTLHAALDAGLIAFNHDGQLIISKSLSRADAAAIGLRHDMRLPKVPERMRIYLKHHRENIFRAE